MRWLGVDTGGTFTDFVYWDGDSLRVHKVLSTPGAPERAILQGIAELGLACDELSLVHGSTVATNAVLESKGVRTAYVTNRGFGDVLSIGRQTRRELYNLQPVPPAPPVPEALCWETGGRRAADGTLLEALTTEHLAALRALVAQHRPQAVAINLLFAFLDDREECEIAAAMPEGIFVSRSSAVLNEYREYERGIATWLNAYVGPLMQGYLSRLAAAVAPARVAVMQSHGGTVAAARAGERAVELLLSGPAGGLVGARHQARLSGIERLLTFDMGGTSTDVALIDGEIRLSTEGEIAGYPVAVPMVDLHTIGAGGGSIAWIDAGGMLQVGPQSAGADPGPACYGRGGRVATVTDANLVLGRLPRDLALGGHLKLDADAAWAALDHLGQPLGIAPEALAEGIVRIANERMAQALRVISVQRGYDPRDFTLLPFGGAGGLHVCALADALGTQRILVPRHGGVLSALGMVVAPVARQRSHTRIGLLSEASPAALAEDWRRMRESIAAELAAEGTSDASYQESVDLRYEGQSFTLNLPRQDDLSALAAAFHAEHRRQYGHALDLPVELVTLRVRAATAGMSLPAAACRSPAGTAALHRPQKVWGESAEVAVLDRAELPTGMTIDGPAIVVEPVATLWIAAGWRGTVDAAGNLLLERREVPIGG